MDSENIRILGRTGLKVGRLGVSASYGAPTRSFEKAFERGCNYFYWGSKRKDNMRQAIVNICGKGKRDDLIIVLQSYSRSAFLMEHYLKKALNALSLHQADVLLLGWYNRKPPRRIIDKALDMKARGLYRFLAISGHNRPLFPQLAKEGIFDIFHIRYNAAHRGAEEDVFPHLPKDDRPGIVTYTATRWGNLLNPKKMPPGESPPKASDCYRFVITNANVDVCMTGPRNEDEMKEALRALDLGPLGTDTLERMRKIGAHVHGKGKFR